ncbi:hypothetical protein T08_11696 [Trichinella sp. T8]|nr:hypothetical protein T08_11696 [Trichinella sp. T8]
MEIVRSSHVQRCCRPLSPEATAGPMSGPWTCGKVWPAYSTAFDWCVPRAHWPAGARVRTATLPRRRFCKPRRSGRIQSSSFDRSAGEWARRISQTSCQPIHQHIPWPLGSALDTPRSIFRSNRKRPKCNGNLWITVPSKGPKKSMASGRLGFPCRFVSRDTRAACLTPRVHRLPHAWPEIASLESIHPAFAGTQSGHRTWYCAWPRGQRSSVPLERAADHRHGHCWPAYVAKDRPHPPGTPLSRPSTGTGGRVCGRLAVTGHPYEASQLRSTDSVGSVDCACSHVWMSKIDKHLEGATFSMVTTGSVAAATMEIPH